jgi:DNA-binding PadR family transcriptional regulator
MYDDPRHTINTFNTGTTDNPDTWRTDADDTWRSRGRRRGGRMHEHDQHHDHGGHDGTPGGRRGGPEGRHRARRGAVRDGIVVLLAERPMHGYELITELESRSGGRWRPSPGAIYPALEKLERHGLIVGTDTEGKRRFELTDRGRELVEAIRQSDTDGQAPWQQGAGPRGDSRRLIAEIGGQLRQIGRFGTAGQRAAAAEALERTKRELYAILATAPDDADAPADTGADQSDPATGNTAD